jgi:hypothetical protein
MDASSLKADETCLRLDDSVSEVLFISNINIPARYFNNQEVIERVLDFIESEFSNQTPFYQICGTYYLRHKKTGEEKFWTGSFFPSRNLAAGQLANLFQPYNREGLRTRLGQLDEIALSWAYIGGVDTVWLFDRPHSAIVNINCRVPALYRKLVERGLSPGQIDHHGGFFRRRHVTFALP